MSNNPSIFSRIIAGEIPAKVEYEDEDTLVIHDIHPRAPIHFLCIIKKEIPNIQSFKDEELMLFAALFKAIREVTKKWDISDYRLVINNGPGAGQTVFHLHCHLLARVSFSDEDL